MLRPADVLVLVVVVTVVVWLNVPRLLVPALVLSILLLSAYRWRQDGREPMAAERYRWRLVASCIVIAAIHVPLILRLVPPNSSYGFRADLTRSSADIWYSANAFLGWAMLVAAVTSAGALVILPSTVKRWRLLAAFLVPMLGALVASLMYLERLR